MSKKLYGPITTSQDLVKLQAQATEEEIAVGFTESKSIYKLDEGKTVKITIAEAAEILDVSPEVIQEIVEAKGVYELPIKEDVALEQIPKEKEVVQDEKNPKEEILPGEKPIEEEVHEEQPIEKEKPEKETVFEEIVVELTTEQAINILKNDEDFQERLNGFIEFLQTFKK